MKIVITFFVGLACVTASYAQTIPRNSIGVSYYGEFLKHPGLAVDFSHVLIPQRKDSISILEAKHVFSTGLELTYYAHKNSYRSLSFVPNLQYQFLFKRGFVVGMNAGIGYIRQFNSSDTYSVGNAGAVEKISWAGRNKLYMSGSLRMGQNFLKRKKLPFGWHFDLGVFTESPSNTGNILHLFVKSGVSYYLNRKVK